jgi:hypothetical protein
MFCSNAELASSSSVKIGLETDVDNSLTESVTEVLCVASVTASDVTKSGNVLSVGETVDENVVVELFSPDNELPVSLEEVKGKKTTVVEPNVMVPSVDKTIVVSLIGLAVIIVELLPN